MLPCNKNRPLDWSAADPAVKAFLGWKRAVQGARARRRGRA
jgi:hypothetical protein